MSYNVHQLLHLEADVRNLGPLWDHSCFFFEDLNGDFKNLFHGTRNINGQIVQAVSVLQKLPELSAEIQSPEAKKLHSNLTKKYHSCRSFKEEIAAELFVVGAVKKLSGAASLGSRALDTSISVLKDNAKTLFTFERCLIKGTLYQSKLYMRTTCRNNNTIMYDYCGEERYGKIHTFIKSVGSCTQQVSEKKCMCDGCTPEFHAVLEEVSIDNHQPNFEVKRHNVLKHIHKAESAGIYSCIPLYHIKEKCVLVEVKSGSWICHMTNDIEKS